MAQELQIRGRDAALQCDRAMDQLSIDAEVKGEIRTAFLVAFEIGEPMFFFKEKKKARIMEELLAIFADGAQKKAEHFAQGFAAGLFRD